MNELLRHPDRIVAGVALLILLTMVIVQIVGAVNEKDETLEVVGDARKLVEEVEGNSFPPPLKDEEAYSGRVVKAWEELPVNVEPLTKWDLYPLPR